MRTLDVKFILLIQIKADKIKKHTIIYNYTTYLQVLHTSPFIGYFYFKFN